MEKDKLILLFNSILNSVKELNNEGHHRYELPLIESTDIVFRKDFPTPGNFSGAIAINGKDLYISFVPEDTENAEYEVLNGLVNFILKDSLFKAFSQINTNQ